MFKNIKVKMKKLLDKKGLNCIQTTLICVIIFMCMMTMLDLMELHQELSATTTAMNYVTRLIGRQGGISTVKDEQFKKLNSYGHGNYITSQECIDLLNVSLNKAFSNTKRKGATHNAIGDENSEVEIWIKIYELDKNNGYIAKDTGHKTKLTKDTNIGVYVSNDIEKQTINSNLLISQEDILFHKTFYLVEGIMYYEPYTFEKMIYTNTPKDSSAYTHDEGFKWHTKKFYRIIIPTYYSRVYNTNDYKNMFINDGGNDKQWFVK